MDDQADFCVHCGRRVETGNPFYRAPDFNNAPKFKYCTHCGAELKEGADVCLNCGRRVMGPPHCPPPARSNTNNVLATIAKVFMVLTCASCGMSALSCLISGLTLMSVVYATEESVALGVTSIVMAVCSLIALAWCIPLTVHVFRRTKNHEPIPTATKVCILIFVNIISGILLLCMKEPAPRPMDEFYHGPDVPPQN